uniref:Heme NO-binding domain-containing protein n=1 Tax=Plectus sambesii TaxID=2011161 RepID=A0A914WSB0_9BILA
MSSPHLMGHGALMTMPFAIGKEQPDKRTKNGARRKAATLKALASTVHFCRQRTRRRIQRKSPTMFGWIHESFRQLVNRKYGRDVWLRILEISNFEEGTECEISHYYKDEDTMRIVNAMANIIGVPVEEVWEAYGGFLIQFTLETGWDELLRAMAQDLEGFLDSLDSLHYFIDHVVYKTKLKGPSFRCEPQNDGSLLLHYYSKRSGLYPIVKGVVREVARRLYDTDVVMKVQERKQEHLDTTVAEHVVFTIQQVDNGSGHASRSITTKSALDMQPESFPGPCALPLRDFCIAFPHHLCFDRDLFLEHFGLIIIP